LSALSSSFVHGSLTPAGGSETRLHTTRTFASLRMTARGARFAHAAQTRSLCCKRRGALLHVCRQAFLRVFALEQQLLVLAFHGPFGLHGDLPTGLHRAFDEIGRASCRERGSYVASG